MHRTIEAIVHPDGRVEALELVTGDTPRRALLTILEEPPLTAIAELVDTSESRLDAILRAAGLLEVPDDISAALQPLSEEARDTLARRIPPGTPLSHIVIEDRDERF